MKATARRCLLLLTLGLSTLPAYALGDQINVFIYGAIGVIVAGVAGAIVLLSKLLGGFFPKKPHPVSPQLAAPQPTGAQPITSPLRFLLILVSIMVLVLVLLN